MAEVDSWNCTGEAEFVSSSKDSSKDSSIDSSEDSLEYRERDRREENKDG